MAISGGNDSSLMLSLLWEAVESIPLELRTKMIHVICSVTGVETPAMTEYVHRCLLKIQENANRGSKTSNGPLPFTTHLVTPNLKNSFWYKVLGRGTLVPTGNVRTRWCTGHLKITPALETLSYIVAKTPIQLGQEHNVILMMVLGMKNLPVGELVLSLMKLFQVLSGQSIRILAKSYVIPNKRGNFRRGLFCLIGP